MDVIKIGQFIKSLRKERSLTQREVAEKLNVSEKTISKWETGRGAPDLSLMLPLCKFFDISMNELLSGEKLTQQRYVEKAEENIASLVCDRTSPKKKIIISTISSIFATLASIAIVMLSAFFITQIWLKLVMIGIAFIVVCTNIAVILLVAVSAEVYQCENCKEYFVPTLREYFLAPHTFKKRCLKCPYCGKKSWNKSHFRQQP